MRTINWVWQPPLLCGQQTGAAVICTIAICVMSILCIVAVAEAPADHGFGEDYEDFSIQIDSSSAEAAGPVLKVDVDLGSLKSGEKGVAIVTIHNPFEHDLPISSARASCSCAKSKLLGKTIPAGGTAQLIVAITVPIQKPNAEFVGTVSLGVDRNASQITTLRDVIVTIRYTIAGMLSFVDRHASIAVRPDETRTLLIPFVATIPGMPENIGIDGSGFVLGAPGSLVQVDDKWFVKLKVSSENASPEGVFGQLTLVAKEHDVSDTINLALYIEHGIQISPRTLRFRPTEGGLEATGILHFSKPQEEKGARRADLAPKKESRVFCEAFLGEKKLEVEIKRISSNVHRLKVVFDDSKEALQSLIETAEGSKEISWNVIDNENRHLIKSTFTLGP